MPDVGVTVYAETPFASNRSSTVMLISAAVSSAAVPSTVKLTLQIVSGPVAVTGRVSGDAGDAVITDSYALTVRTEAAHTPESKLTELI